MLSSLSEDEKKVIREYLNKPRSLVIALSLLAHHDDVYSIFMDLVDNGFLPGIPWSEDQIGKFLDGNAGLKPGKKEIRLAGILNKASSYSFWNVSFNIEMSTDLIERDSDEEMNAYLEENNKALRKILIYLNQMLPYDFVDKIKALSKYKDLDFYQISGYMEVRLISISRNQFVYVIEIQTTDIVTPTVQLRVSVNYINNIKNEYRDLFHLKNQPLSHPLLKVIDNCEMDQGNTKILLEGIE